MRQKILQTGNSLAITIPSKLVKILGLKPGDEVEVKSDLSRGSMRCIFTSTGQMSFLSGNSK